MFFFLCKDFIYLILERREEEGEREGEKINVWELHQSVALSQAPNWRPGPQPRHVLCPGTELAPFWFTGQHSIYWTILARASVFLSCKKSLNSNPLCYNFEFLFRHYPWFYFLKTILKWNNLNMYLSNIIWLIQVGELSFF